MARRVTVAKPASRARPQLFPEKVRGSASAGYADDAVRCARRLIDVGNSVSEHWQRRIDRVQRSGGVHIGIAVGDLNLMPLRAFSGSHFGFIGDAINMTARLVAVKSESCWEFWRRGGALSGACQGRR